MRTFFYLVTVPFVAGLLLLFLEYSVFKGGYPLVPEAELSEQSQANDEILERIAQSTKAWHDNSPARSEDIRRLLPLARRIRGYSGAQLSQRIFRFVSLETPSTSRNSSTAWGKSESPWG